MGHLLERLLQLIINQQIKMMIDKGGVDSGFCYLFLASVFQK